MYKRQGTECVGGLLVRDHSAVHGACAKGPVRMRIKVDQDTLCLLYTSDAADERSSVDLGGRRILKKKKRKKKTKKRGDRTRYYTEGRRHAPHNYNRRTHHQN